MRYHVSLKTKEYHEHRGVWFRLFHFGELDDNIYCGMLGPGLDCEDPYLRCAVEATFDEKEVEALRWYFAQWHNLTDFQADPVGVICEDCCGPGALAVGGTDDFYMFSEHEDWPPALGWIYGYYDLEMAEAGPYVRNPELAVWRVSLMDNGGLVVKRPPF
jgi:hypothetical protein